MLQLKNKVVVITGGSKGIGLATAQLFAKEGAKLVITGRSAETLKKAKTQIEGDVLAVPGDMAKLADIDALYDIISKKYGKIDVLFANAGDAMRAPVHEVTEELFDHITNLNYKGVYFCVRKILPHLNKGASIILNASVAGMLAMDHHSVYSATKAAVIHLGKTFAADLAAYGIRVNVVSPGYIKTPLWGQWLDNNPEKYHALCQDVPLGRRFGQAKEIATMVLFLASDASSYVTAQNFAVDGGLSSIFMELTKNPKKNQPEIIEAAGLT